MAARRPLAARFEEKVNRLGPTPPHLTTCCWLWQAAVDHCGYGWIGLGNRRIGKAHRVALQLAGVAVPAEACVLHHCDTPSCVRPEHLYVGTQLENARDRKQRGRERHASGSHAPHTYQRGAAHWTHRQPEKVRGSRNGRAKLAEDDVRAIRRRVAAGEQCKVVARDYPQVHVATVTRAAREGWGTV